MHLYYILISINDVYICETSESTDVSQNQLIHRKKKKKKKSESTDLQTSVILHNSDKFSIKLGNKVEFERFSVILDLHKALK